MLQSHLGELAALITASLWTITALAFEQASKRVGSLTVNLVRLFLAFVFYCLYNLVTGRPVLPFHISQHNLIWLTVSAVIGFVIGDYCLFKAYEIIGSRISSLLMALAPPLSAVFGWMILGENFSLISSVGMLLTIAGIALVILDRPTSSGSEKKIRISGILFGIGGAAGQAIGLVFSKYGMEDLDPFTASQVRVMAGFISFLILFTVLNQWKRLLPLIRSSRSMGYITTGSFTGPFLGVSFSLMAVKFTSTGIAATIMAIVPILIIPPSVLLFHEKITWKDMTGALLAVGGVAIFFL